ncbi:MAG TPA: thiamine-phosphate kinase [Bauldia sp.]|nr:thiamine-phosphate kinase [Bauldia sp.]
MPKAKRPGEFALIDRYFRPLATDPGAFGLVDDAALYRQRPDDDLVLTTDTVAAGVHFFVDDPPESIAKKALRVNLSDLAAKGAEPFGYLLSLALPANWTSAWLKRFASGLAVDQKTYGVSLLGGDTTRAAGGLSIAITALGRVPKGRMVLRSGAKPGDLIFVTGTIGDGALGLRMHGKKGRGATRLRDRYLHPQPRMALAPVLRAHASAAMDVSDGLVGDLGHICDASKVGAEIGAHEVPLSPAAAAMLLAEPKLLPVILNGGDDYEILATVRASSAVLFARDAEAAGVSVTRIGAVTAGEGPPVVRDSGGKVIRLATGSHTHF